MSQGALHRLEVIPVLERQNRKRMTQPMNAGIRSADSSGNLPILIIHRLRMEVCTKCTGKHKRGLLLLCGFPALSVLPGIEFLEHLFPLASF